MRMQGDSSPVFATLGQHLVDEITVPKQRLNLLFSSLILTLLGVFLGGNLLLLNTSVLWHSVLITLPCLGLVLLFYALSRLLESLPWGLVLTYSALVALVYARVPGAAYVFYTGCAIAAIYALRFLRLERRYWWSVALMAVIGTALVLGVARAYTTFDMLPRLHLGDVHQDTLFHASIAAMIKQYGVTSTGLHGLVETPYHVLSHVLMAGISRLSGIGVIEVYGVANWVLFAPLLLFGIAAFCAMLDRAGQLSVPVVWGFSALLLSALPLLFGRWGLWDSFFVSESYLVSLGLLLLGLGLLYKRHLTISDILLVALAAVLIANAKASVGLIFAGLWLTRLLMIPGDSRVRVFAALLLSTAAVGWSMIDAAGAASGSLSISPLHYVRSYSYWGNHLGTAGSALLNGDMPPIRTFVLGAAALAGYIVFHYIVSWIVVLQIGFRRGLRNLLEAPIAVYSLAAVAAGLSIGLTVAIAGGSAYYFSNVAFFVSLPALAAMLSLGWQRWELDQRLLLGLGIIVIAVVSRGVYYHHSILSPAHSTRADHYMISQLLEFKERSPLNLVLRPSGELLADNPLQRCTAQPFVFPAVSERPWVGVIQSAGDCPYVNFGYAQYGISSGDQQVKMPPKLLPGISLQQ